MVTRMLIPLVSLLLGVAAAFPLGAEPALQGRALCEQQQKHLFINLASERAQRATVAFMVAQANLFAQGAKVYLFLSDAAAHLVLEPAYMDREHLVELGFPEPVEEQDAILHGLQAVDTANPLPSLKELREMGVTVFGCPLCVQEALAAPYTIFGADEDGDGMPDVDMQMWDQFVARDAQGEPIADPISPADFAVMYSRIPVLAICAEPAATLSF